MKEGGGGGDKHHSSIQPLLRRCTKPLLQRVPQPRPTPTPFPTTTYSPSPPVENPTRRIPFQRESNIVVTKPALAEQIVDPDEIPVSDIYFRAGTSAGVAETGAVVGAQCCGDNPEQNEDAVKCQGRIEGVDWKVQVGS